MPTTGTSSPCLCCGHATVLPVLTVTDHSVSGEQFPILECSACGFRVTGNAPDAAHIGPYYISEDYISHTNTSRGLINQLYQWARVFTLRQKKKLITSISRKSTGDLLEVGAGTGYFAETMQKGGWQVTALEPDAGAREIARQRAGLHLLPSDHLFELPSNHFDVITLWHVLEHVHELSSYLHNFHRILRRDGFLIIAVPNYTSPDAQHYGTHWAAYDVPRHLYHFSPVAMRKLLAAHQLQVIAVRPMWLDAFYVSLLSEKYAKGGNNIFSGFLQGALSNVRALMKGKNTSSLIYIARPIG